MNLRKLYRRIPAMTCRPGCGDCCGPVPWTAAEWDRVKARVPAWVALDAVDCGDGMTAYAVAGTASCPFFANGCTVHDDRPFMCRLFGTAPDARLTCPHGCKPARSLSALEARRLTDQYRVA